MKYLCTIYYDEEVLDALRPEEHAALVRVLHGIADGAEEAQTALELLAVGGRPVRQPLAQRAPAHELHREEVPPVLGPPGLVDGGDVGVLEARERLRLALEHAHLHVVEQRTAAHDLERDPPSGALLLRLPDDPHAALAELAKDAVAPDAGLGPRFFGAGHGRPV